MRERTIPFQPIVVQIPGVFGLQVPTFHLPRGYLYRSLHLFVEAVITDNGAGAAPAYSQDAAFRTLSRVRIKTHADTPWDLSGRMLKLVGEYEDKVAADVALVPPAGAIGGVHVIDTSYEINFEDQFAAEPAKFETGIKSWGLSVFDLEAVTAAVMGDMMVPGIGGALAFTSIAIEGFAKVFEVTEEEKDLLDKGKVSLKRMIEQNDPFAVAVAMRTFRNQNLHRGLVTSRLYGMVTDTIGGIAGVRVDGLILRTRAHHKNVELIREQPGIFLQQDTTQRLGFNALAGMYLWDFDQEGAHLSSPVSTEEDDFTMEFSNAAPVAAAQLVVVQEEIAPAQYIAI